MATSRKTCWSGKPRRDARGLLGKRKPEGGSRGPSQEGYVESANTTELEGEMIHALSLSLGQVGENIRDNDAKPLAATEITRERDTEREGEG